MNRSMAPLLMSLRPRHAELIFDGRKRVELRRRIPAGFEGREVYVYVSRTCKAVCGGFRIGEIWSGRPDEMWTKVGSWACLIREDFEDYYRDASRAYALEITDVWMYESAIGLSKLRSLFGVFAVPQSWRYLRENEHATLVDIRLCEDGRESIESSE